MNEKFSFQRGWSQVRKCDYNAVKSEIFKSLKLNSATQFYLRLNGKIELRHSQHEAVVQIFARYGITDVWGPALLSVEHEQPVIA